MKKLFLSLTILTCVITMIGTSWAESPPSRSQTIGKVTITLSGNRIDPTTGMRTPLFRIHAGDVSVPRTVNREYGMTADIYEPCIDSNQWMHTVARRGQDPKHQKVGAKDLPHPMNLLDEEELGCIEVFLVYYDKNMNIYLRPLEMKKVKKIFERMDSLFNGFPA